MCDDEADARAAELQAAASTHELFGIPVTLNSPADCTAIAAALRTAAYGVRCATAISDFALDEDHIAAAPITDHERRAVASCLETLQPTIADLSPDDAELTVSAVLGYIVSPSTRVDVSTHRQDSSIDVLVGTARFTIPT